MLHYLIILILCISNLFSDNKSRKENVLLFHINNQLESFNIIQSEKYLVDYLPLNNFLIEHGAYKIERWSKFASDADVYNGIRFSKIYRVYFTDKKSADVNYIKNELL